MTYERAIQAMNKQELVHHKDDPKSLGLITCFSDDKSTVYFKPYGGSVSTPYGYRGSWVIKDTVVFEQ